MAAIDGLFHENSAARIIGHANQAYMFGSLTLNEQRGYEAVIKAIMSASDAAYSADAARVAVLEAIEVKDTVL